MLVELATDLGLDAGAFERTLTEVEGDAMRAHMAKTRELMGRLNAQGFPTFALERDGQMSVIGFDVFLGRPEVLREWLRAQLRPTAAAAAATWSDIGCGPDSCAV